MSRAGLPKIIIKKAGATMTEAIENDFILAEPPATTRQGGLHSRGKHAAFAEFLKANQGQFAIFPNRGINASAANQIKAGKYADFRPVGAFEAVARAAESGTGSDIYIRYVGEPVAEPVADEPDWEA